MRIQFDYNVSDGAGNPQVDRVVGDNPQFREGWGTTKLSLYVNVVSDSGARWAIPGETVGYDLGLISNIRAVDNNNNGGN